MKQKWLLLLAALCAATALCLFLRQLLSPPAWQPSDLGSAVIASGSVSTTILTS